MLAVGFDKAVRAGASSAVHPRHISRGFRAVERRQSKRKHRRCVVGCVEGLSRSRKGENEGAERDAKKVGRKNHEESAKNNGLINIEISAAPTSAGSQSCIHRHALVQKTMTKNALESKPRGGSTWLLSGGKVFIKISEAKNPDKSQPKKLEKGTS